MIVMPTTLMIKFGEDFDETFTAFQTKRQEDVESLWARYERGRDIFRNIL